MTKRGATRKPAMKQRRWHFSSKWLKPLMTLMLLLVVIAASTAYQQHHLLPIRHVKVQGQFEYVDKQQFLTAIKPYAQGGFLTVDVDTIQQQGLSLAWVKQVQVRRIWPDSLHLKVEEHTPMARWYERYYITQQGKLLPPIPPGRQNPDIATQLIGPKATETILAQRYLAFSEKLIEINRTIRRLTMNERRAWSLILDNGLEIVLGRVNSQQRFERFLSVYRDILHPYQTVLKTIDMRYPNGLAVRWKSTLQPSFNGTAL